MPMNAHVIIINNLCFIRVSFVVIICLYIIFFFNI